MEDFQLERLIERSYPRILRAALVLSGDAWVAEDLAQETFLQALGSMRRFSRRSSPETWLYSILLNLHRKRLRSKERRWRRWLIWFDSSRSRPLDDSPESRMEEAEWQQTLWRAVQQLPEAQQHAVVLRYSEQLTYEQIAHIQRCPLGTVKSRLHHAVTALRGMLEDEERTIPADCDSLPTGTRT